MSRLVFGKKPSQSQVPRVDRFILPRESFVDERRRTTWRVEFENQTIDIWEAKYQRQKKYRQYLDEVFGRDPNKGSDVQDRTQSWPCAPRKRSYLSSADSILDLPTYSYATFPELLDWSSSNILVAALGTNYHLFSWQNQSVVGQGVTEYGIHCCKFNPKGDLLLIGTQTKVVELHDASTSKKVNFANCKCCTSFGNRLCAITAIDWSPTGNSYVTGCSKGLIISFDRRSMVNNRRRINRSPILTVRISPDARYVAAVALNSPSVHVMVWPYLQYHSSLHCNWIVKTIAWHPWRSALLGVGVMTSNLQTAIGMWDIPCTRLREAGLGFYINYSLDVILFSHRTGELVLSLWNSELSSYPKTCSQLLVLSDPYTVVDQSGDSKYGLDRVRTMVFSPDGTKLATATADEDLIIWNFLPEDKGKKSTKSKRFSAMPVYLDQFTHGIVVR